MPTTPADMPDPSASQTVFPLLCRSAEIRAVAQQLAETGEIREQPRLTKKPGQSLTTIGVLPILSPRRRLSRWFRRSFSRRELFYQRHSVDRVKEVHPAEVFWSSSALASSLIGMVEVLDASTYSGVLSARFLPVRLFSLLGFDNRFYHNIHAVKPGVVERWGIVEITPASFRPSILPRSSCCSAVSRLRSCRGLTTCR